MPLAPRTLAITWAGIALIDLACTSILAVEVSRHDPGDSNLKYRIVALVLLALASLFSALASWRCCRRTILGRRRLLELVRPEDEGSEQ
uniref:Transmembrane protein n=1 Tax=Mycena chlorophos TaxID=658473 RepID=A0ABQ0LLJ5_MYCCL|nr:predicted protein [Mycena chlorophos]